VKANHSALHSKEEVLCTIGISDVWLQYGIKAVVNAKRAYRTSFELEPSAPSTSVFLRWKAVDRAPRRCII